MRTFDDIIPPSRRKVEGDMPPRMNDSRPSARPSPPRPRGRFPYITVVVAVAIIGVSVFALLRFSSAKVEIVPIMTSLQVQGSYTAGGAGGTTSGTLPFQIITAKKTATQTIAASGTRTVSSSASGSITIYNTQSKPQKLIANTRFANSAGVIFRIHTGVTVPAGSSSKPGTVTATIYADAPGPSYNVDAGSFTVPGLAGTPQASTVYGRSTTPTTGGASGTVPAVDAAAEQAAASALQGKLGPDLSASIESQVPPGYVLIPGASATTYRALPAAPSATSGKADIQEEGTITAIVFPSAAFAKTIAATDPGYQGEEITLGPGTSLTLTPTGGLPAADTETFAFTLSGSANLLSMVDSMQIATAVAGKSRSEAQVALTNYPEIKRAILVLRPFWRSAFPEDPASITVTVSASSAEGS